MKLLVGMFAVAACAASLKGLAADRTIESGETVVLTESASYGKLTVNGSLTVNPSVQLTCEKLCVGTGAVDNASLTLMSGATVSVTKASETHGLDCQIGIAGSTNTKLVLADGAVMTVKGTLGLAYGDVVTSASIELNGTASLSATSQMYVNRGSNWASGSFDTDVYYAEIILNGSSCLSLGSNMTKNNNTTARIRFNGGTFLCSGTGAAINDNQAGRLVLESVDGHDIVIERPSDFSTLFSNGSGNNSTFVTSGSGAFVKRGAGKGPLYTYADNDRSSGVTLGATGGLRVEAGGLKLDDRGLSAKILQPSLPVTVWPGASLDLNGQDLAVDDLAVGDAKGLVNTSDIVATLTVGASDKNLNIEALDAKIALVKEGTGTLALGTGSAASVRVTAGSVVFGNRAGHGYPYYKFHVTGPKTNVRLSEFYLYDGERDVTTTDYVRYLQITTGGYVNSGNTTPANLLDRDLTTVWDDRRLGSTTDDRTNLCWVAFAYLPSHPLTGYTMASADKKEVFPGTWTFCGSADGETWTVLDAESGIKAAGTYTKLDTVFPVSFAGIRESFSIGTLDVADGASVTVDAATLSVQSVDNHGGSVVTANGGEVLIASEGDAYVRNPGLSGSGTLAKSGSGETTVVGGGTFAGLVDVRAGTLRFTDTGSEGPWFRFSILANRDNGNVNNQLGELAFYDAKGERLNLGMTFQAKNKPAADLAAGEMTAIYGTAGQGEAPDKMTDGDTTTKAGLYTTTKPNPVTFRLKENAGRVVSYALATGNDHADRDPWSWDLEASADGVSWTTLDQRREVQVGSERSSYLAYNGGNPFFTTNVLAGSCAFSSAATVKVSGGAVLDLSDTDTTVGHLIADCASGGTIRKFTLAASGSLDIVGAPARWQTLTLSVKLEEADGLANLEGWTVTANGKTLKSALLKVDADGFLTVQKAGLVFVVR